ncbi:MAG: MATE family efflux transporter [Ruminococcus sp.]|nr:MATE family efflux transporter [Ruminococcus sp.]
MTKSMTSGNPLKLIFEFALPLLLGNLLQQTYNIIDAAIVGRALGSDALAAVGASSSVQFLVMGFCIGICAGFGVPVASSFGAGDTKKMRRAVKGSLIITAVFAALITVVCGSLCGGILRILQTPDNIYGNAYSYLFIIFMGLPFSLLYNLLASLLRSVGDSRTPFIFLAVSTVSNIILDLLFILVFKWGCGGAAGATIASQALSGILCLFYAVKKYNDLLPGKDVKVTAGDVKGLLIMGVPMGLQYSITAIGSMVMQSANNGLGSVYISGFTAGMRIKQFIMCPFDAVATAVSVFCSQNSGAGQYARIKEGLFKGIAAAVSYGAAAGLVLIFFGRNLAGIFVDSGEGAVLDAAGKYLGCLGLFYIAIGFLNVCRMTTQGLGFSGRAVFSGVIEMIARICVSRFLVPLYGFTAICYADQTAWVAACLYIVPTCFYCVKKVSCKKQAVENN